MSAIKPPFEIFYDASGRPADNAKIYIGAEGQNPETVPVSVYWDEAQTIVAKQPLRTIAGAIYRGGNKAQVYGPSRYSIAVKSANDELYAYSASVSNELSSDDINYGAISVTEALDVAIKTVDTFADLSSTTAEIGQQISLRGHTYPNYGGGIFNVVSASGLTANSGTIAINGEIAFVREEKTVYIEDFGCPIDGNSSCVPAFIAARNVVSDITFRAGITYCFDDEILIDKNFKMNFPVSNEYGPEGATLKATFNDSGKSIFKIGSVNKAIQFDLTGVPKVTQSSGLASFSAFNVQSATAYIDGILGTVGINALYITDSYIGRVNRVGGEGKDYLIKIAGNTSLAFGDLNIGGTIGGQSALQIVATDGTIDIKNIYLEAQSSRNIAITNNEQCTINIQNIYAENSSNHDIYCSNANNVTIDCYRTNTNTKSVIVRQSSNINIKNVIASSRLEKYEVLDVDYSSNGIYVGGVMFSNVIDFGGGDNREYVLIRGGISGRPADPIIVNPTLDLSAGGTVSTVGGSAISASIPADTRYRFNTKSITVTNAAPLKIPIIDWRQGEPVVIQCVYKSTDTGVSDFTIGIWRDLTSIQIIQEFHIPSADFQMVTFVCFSPKTTINQYSSLEFRCAPGKTADVHYLSMSYYDGEKIPVGAIDNSEIFISSELDLNTLGSLSVLSPKIGGKSYRFKQYELIAQGATGAGAAGVVSIGDLNSSGAIPGVSATFATSANRGAGFPFTGLAPGGAYPFRDHVTSTPNGWGAIVSTAAAHGGTAKVFIRAVQVGAGAI